MNKVLKRLSNIVLESSCVKYENNYRKVISKIEEATGYVVDSSIFYQLNEDIQYGGALGFKVCECEGDVTITPYIINDDDLNEIKVMTRKDFKVFDQSKMVRELYKIVAMLSCEADIINKKKEFEKIKESSDISKLNDLERRLFKSIENELRTVDIINTYNTGVDRLILNNKYAQMTFDLGVIDEIGHCEIDTIEEKYEEVLLQLYLDIPSQSTMDYNSKFIENMSQEASSIFADAMLQHIPDFNEYSIKGYATELEKAVSECSLISCTYEISTFGEFKFEDSMVSSSDLYISIDEFESTLKKQLFLLKKNQDIIFKNYYKIIKVVSVQKMLRM